MTRCLRFAIPFAATALLAAPATAGELVLDLRGIRSGEGRVYAAVHAPAEGVKFPDPAGMIAATWWLARPGDQRVTIHDLPPGRYAVNAYHDENGNGDLDTNMLGIPSEGFAFANDAMGVMGPPGFSGASVLVEDGNATTTATLTMSY